MPSHCNSAIPFEGGLSAITANFCCLPRIAICTSQTKIEVMHALRKAQNDSRGILFCNVFPAARAQFKVFVSICCHISQF